MVQLVEALRYKSEGRGVRFLMVLLKIFRPHYGRGVESACNGWSTRNISWGLKVTGAKGWQPYQLQLLIVFKSGSLNQDRKGIALI